MSGQQRAVFHDSLLINTNTLKASKVNHITNYIYASTACCLGCDLVAGKFRYTGPTHPQSLGPETGESDCSYNWVKLMGEFETVLAQSPSLIVKIYTQYMGQEATPQLPQVRV
jgi:hypothetical protein